jgi:deoxyadenosine/deoxycytidine kinase
MTIVCFEGPSAVGKTTSAQVLRASNGIEVVPDVAALFGRPSDESADWYLERQVERWQLALRHSVDRDVVLDGDPFQPLWYNWTYDFEGWHSLDQLQAFYRPRLARNELAFPDLYVLFRASVSTLRQRKSSDTTRSRRNFEHHLKFIEPQQKYFAVMEQLAPGLVLGVSSDIVAENVSAVAQALSARRTRPDSVAVFDGLINWLRAGLA